MMMPVFRMFSRRRSPVAAGTTLLLALSALLIWAGPTLAQSFETRGTAAWIYDVTSDTVLFEKQADLPLPPASMSKLMTLNMLFEALRDGRVSLTTEFSVSTRAAEMGGSTMYLDQRDRPTVEQLIQGIIVMSGNDACVVVAEGLAGSEDGFARMMNERAKALGMENSTFANASGWPDPDHRMSVADLGILTRHLIVNFPEYYGYFGQREFAYDGRAPDNRFNRNPLLRLNIGADGLKTGHTSEAGYGLVGSATQGSRRVIFVLTGLQSETARSEEAERAVNWAFRAFSEQTILQQGQQVGTADVWLGQAGQVGLISARDATVLMPVQPRDDLGARLVYTSPAEAPIAAGQQLAELIIPRNGLDAVRLPLVAANAVESGGILVRLTTAAKVLMRRFLGEESLVY